MTRRVHHSDPGDQSWADDIPAAVAAAGFGPGPKSITVTYDRYDREADLRYEAEQARWTAEMDRRAEQDADDARERYEERGED